MDVKIGIENDSRNIKSNRRNSEKALHVLYYDISDYSSTNQFLICCAGVLIFYLIYGYLQELIFTVEGFKPYGWYLTLVQFAFYSVFGFAECGLNGDTKRHIPLQTYMLLALLTLGTMGFSNSSLGYLNYPTQVIFKCCKLIPCLIGSILIQQKKYGLLDYVAAAALSLGLTLFTLADSQLSPNFDIIGLSQVRRSQASSAFSVLGFWQMLPTVYRMTTVFRKKTHTGKYLNYQSNHQKYVKEGVAYSEFSAKSLCSDNDGLKEEFKKVELDLRHNGYPESNELPKSLHIFVNHPV
ncbi:hypothetical protein J6590_006631 [Homalodisca vitripennis]|nr:hypothetical protein J6590_006631 [Homalodisca vitripennis]